MADPLEQLGPHVDEPPAPEFVERLRVRITTIEARNFQGDPMATDITWHLAQLNLGLFKAPLDSPEMAEFANALDRINAVADAAPGFVWRLKDDDGGPSSNVEVPGADDPMLASNLSVWEDLESLRDFMYRTDHVSYLRRRGDWFRHPDAPMTVAWWMPAGTIPTLEDALDRLEGLRNDGPSDAGWPLTQPRPKPGAAPSGSSLIPYLTVGNCRAALEFYAEVFDAAPQGELFEMEDGRIGHAEVSIGGQMMYLADDFPEINLVHPRGHGGPVSMSLVIHVADCDSVFEHAIAAGATAERQPANQHGHRSGWFVDPWGHRWCPTGPERL